MGLGWWPSKAHRGVAELGYGWGLAGATGHGSGMAGIGGAWLSGAGSAGQGKTGRI